MESPPSTKRRRISDPERDAQAVAVGASMDDHAGCDLCGIPRLIGAEQRAEHLNGKKHRAKIKSYGYPGSFAGWSAEPTWSAADCAAIQQEFERARQRHSNSSGRCPGDRCSRSFCVLDCQVKPSEIRNDLPDLELYLLAEGHRRPAILRVIREMQKGAAHLNKERLYGDDAAVAALRLREPSASDAHHGLAALAHEHNCSTTDLGLLLAGSQVMLQATATLSAGSEVGVVTPCAAGAEDGLIRKQWAEAAVKLAKYDFISGYRVLASRGHVKTDRSGADGEAMLAIALDAAGVPASCYRTERQQVAAEFSAQERGKRATPDALFDTAIVVQGRPVNWIEVKNKLLIPGVSSEDEHRAYGRQIEKYVKRFGAGAVVWTSSSWTTKNASMSWAAKNAPNTGFCQTIHDQHGDVVHFNLTRT